MNNMKRFIIFGLGGAVLLFAGCAALGRKPKEDRHISVQVEESFKQRWIEQRGAELMRQGLTPDVARSRAIEEFRQRYEFTSAARE